MGHGSDHPTPCVIGCNSARILNRNPKKKLFHSVWGVLGFENSNGFRSFNFSKTSRITFSVFSSWISRRECIVMAKPIQNRVETKIFYRILPKKVHHSIQNSSGKVDLYPGKLFSSHLTYLRGRPFCFLVCCFQWRCWGRPATYEIETTAILNFPRSKYWLKGLANWLNGTNDV